MIFKSIMNKLQVYLIVILIISLYVPTTHAAMSKNIQTQLQQALDNYRSQNGIIGMSVSITQHDKYNSYH